MNYIVSKGYSKMGFINKIVGRKVNVQKPSTEAVGIGNRFFYIVSGYMKDYACSFNSSATNGELDDLEKKIAHPLPDSFKHFYQVHNGEKNECAVGIFLGLPALSLYDIHCEWQCMKEYADSDDDEILSAIPDKIQEVYFNELWIPFAHDGSGNYLALDFAPGCKGKVGQIINCGIDERTHYVIVDSFDEFLEIVIGQFEEKRLTIQWDGQNRHLEWTKTYKDISIIDIEMEADSKFSFIWDSFTDYWKVEIERVLGKKPLSVHDLEQIRRLRMMNIEHLDLAPLEYFTSLGEYIASRSTIKDFLPIGNVHTLKTLYLAKTNLSDIRFLRENVNLENLSIGNSQVTDISVLTELKKLKSVSLENLAIIDYSPLTDCTKIKELDVSGCEDFDVASIASLNLTDLNIYRVPLHNMDFLKEQYKLKSLGFDTCFSSDFAVIEESESLTSITCPFVYFEAIIKICKRKIQFTIMGQMTQEQDKLYMDYMHSKS